jgi:hypothetical protein
VPEPHDFYPVDIIRSPWLPEGTALLVPKESFFTGALTSPLLWYRDPWPPAPRHFTDVAKRERDKGLEFLADLLDGMCRDLGMDPDEVWRGPKQREQDLWMAQMRYIAHERVALTINNPSDYLKITVT